MQVRPYSFHQWQPQPPGSNVSAETIIMETTRNIAENTPNTVGTNGNSNSLNMTDTSTPILPPTPCPCPDNSETFFCPILQRRMTPHLAQLCRTRPDYRQLWEQQRDADPTAPRQMPPAAAWLTCPHWSKPIATLPGSTLGAGCRSSQQPVYQCGYFHEPVVRRAADSHRERIASEIPGYTGRTCQRCEIPTD